MTDDAQLAEIARYLRVLVALEVRKATDGKTKQQSVEMLSNAGLDAGTIADLTGIPKTTVAPIVSRLKKNP